jgi:glycosyltransferase involved in cell wall biosynthesis
MSVVVSVVVLAYNQEKYIERAIRSILSQKVNFKYEIIIGEDCSTDNTRKICLALKDEFPNIINVICNSSNLGLLKNYISTISCAKGKYIAICAGDDYWIDENKLQTQVSFLDKNSSFSMVFTNAYLEFENEINKREVFSNIEEREYKGDEIILKWTVPASSVVFRNNLIDFSFLLRREYYAEDLITYLKLNEVGKLMGMSKFSIVYQQHSDSINANPDNKLYKYVTTISSINQELNFKYNETIKKDLSIVYYKYAIHSIKKMSILTGVVYLCKSCKYDYNNVVKMLFQSIIN